MGARGGIGGTYGVMPDLFLQLNHLISIKELEKAQQLQYAINDIIAKLVSGHGNMYGMIKAVLKLNEGLELGSVRAPLTSLIETDHVIAEVAAEMIQEARERYC
ncbi:N-acetylneuraminate lyase [Chlamydia trachomatis]|nr:N-acetylneuraminate lyase [Chlamydia trachomatis]